MRADGLKKRPLGSLVLVLAVLTAALLAPWRLVGRQSHEVQAAQAGTDVLISPGLEGPAALQAADPLTLICFQHQHFSGDPPQPAGVHLIVYTISWRVADGSTLEFDLASGGGLPCPGSIALTITGAAAGAVPFEPFTCYSTEVQGCTLDIPVTSGGSVSGIPGQPTLTVPADQTAVLHIATSLEFVAPD